MAANELAVVNPFTEDVAARFPMLPDSEIEGVVARARAAHERWRDVPLEERKALCRAFIEAFRDMGGEVAASITAQMGKPLAQAQGEVKTMLARAEHMIAIADATLAEEFLPEDGNLVKYIRHEPLGVVLDIVAWNYPLLIAVNVVVPSILAGNSVIIKHSSKTPSCGQAFVDAFARAGAPPQLVQHIVAGHATTSKLIGHPNIDYVSFTGSVRGGHEVMHSAVNRFINMGLELGGKDPAYVCADADFQYTVDNCVDGAFYNAGQSCCAIERIYVDASIYEEFVEAYAAKTREYVLGDPMAPTTTLGPLASKDAPAFLKQQVEAAISAGGTLVVDPREFEKPDTGWFAAPAVVANAPQDSSLMQEESFGPVIGILPVTSDDEALQYMNDSPYGLTASIWTRDRDRAVRIGERIATGTVYMNRCDFCDPGLPWTGVKDTGRGASLSKYGLLQLTRLKSMHLRVRT
jgi:acyl-CoA reductase-like NAD-dependent aldehyde dehydrogenase